MNARSGVIEIEAQHVGGEQVLITLAGETDLATAPLLERELACAIVAGTADVVVDLWDVDLLDTSNCFRLLEAARRLREDERRLILLCDPARHRLLRVPFVQRELGLAAA